MTELHKGNKFYSTVKVGERGQIVIPKKAREEYDIKAGDSLIVFGENDRVIWQLDCWKTWIIKNKR